MTTSVRIAAVVLAGCAMCGCISNPAANPAIYATIPVCSTPIGCDAGWSAARTWVLANSGALKVDSPNYLRSVDPPVLSLHVGAKVSKDIGGAEKYTIRAMLWCRNPVACSPTEEAGQVEFNRIVMERIWKAEHP